MKTYTAQQLTDAFAKTGIGEGDIVYLSTRLFGLGHMADCASREDFLTRVLGAVRAVIGTRGTLVVPTFTQQVGQFGVDYVHEETPCRTGLFNEYVRNLETSIRSLHPVFSVSADGPLAKDICEDVSPVAFGADSAFSRIIQLGGKATCVGFARETGHIVSLMHHVETSFAVPYYYTKFVDADVYVKAKRLEREFFINVKYLDYEVRFDFVRYISALEQAGCIMHAPVGGGDIFTCGAREQFDMGVDLLKQDINAFLAEPPKYVPGLIPCDGPPKSKADCDEVVNWIGHDLSYQ